MRYTGYCRRQQGSIKSDLFEIGGIFCIAMLIAWAILASTGGAGL